MTRVAVATRTPRGVGGATSAVIVLIALGLGAMIAFGQVGVAAVAVVLVPFGMAISSAPYLGLCGGIAAMVLVPAGAGKPGAALALTTVLAAARAHHVRRLSFVDTMVLLFVLAVVASWLIAGPISGFTGSLIIDFLTPVAFYLAARQVGDRAPQAVVWTLLVVSAIASLSLLFELFVTHTTLFVPKQYYLWNQNNQFVFRPAGVLQSPPAAADVLSMASFAALPLLTRLSGWKRALAAGCIALSLVGIVATLDRAAMIGVVVGAVVYLALSRSVRVWHLLGGAAAALIVVLLVVVPLVSSAKWYQEGILRQGTLAARQSYWTAALPLTTNTPSHLAVGHGINSLDIGRPAAPGSPRNPGTPDPDLSSDPLLLQIGPHNQYVRTLFEQGIVGEVLLVGWLGGALVTAAITTRRLRDPGERMLVAGAAAGIAAFAVESAAVDTLRAAPTFAVLAVLSGIIVAYSRRAWSPDRAGAR